MPTSLPVRVAALGAALAVGLPAAMAVADANTNHALKTNFLASQLAPSERVSDVECVDGAADVFACDGLDLLGFFPDDEFITYRDPLTGCAGDAVLGLDPTVLLDDPECLTDTGLSDIWGWTSPETGDEYVLQGKTNGTAIFRVTDPTAPEYLGEVPTLAGTLLWHDIKVYENFAYIGSESVGQGVVVLDLLQLDDMGEAPLPLFPIAPTNRFVPGMVDITDLSTHNIVVDEDNGVLYVVGGGTPLLTSGVCGGGLYAMDLEADPLEPPFLGCFEPEGELDRIGSDGTASPDDVVYVHDAQCADYVGPDPDHQGKDICVTSSEEAILWVDVTDPTNMTEIARLPYPSAAYAHQGWMSEDQTAFFLGDELDELFAEDVTNTRTIVVDMTDLDAPEIAFEHVHDTVAIDHNMYTHDGLLYQSNYTAGLRVFDVAESLAAGELVEVAWFDTFPDDDDAPVTEFSGTWSVYPYFESGTIAVSGIGEGLFLLQRSGAVDDGDPPTQPAPDTGGDTTAPPAPAPDSGPSLPATGGGAALLALAALGGAAALRRRV